MTAAALAFLAATFGVAGCGVLVGSRERAGADRDRKDAPAPRRPAALRALAALGATAARRTAPAGLERRIEVAGRPAGLGARELLAAKLGAALAVAPVGVLAGALAPGRLGFAAIVVAPVGGFLAPDLWLARRAAERARQARRQLPALLDLMRVTVDAGSPPAVALGAVGARTRGPLAAEWRSVARQVEVGVPLGLALAGMAERLPLAEVRALVAALERARRHGAPLGETLAGQARDARAALRRHVQEEAGRAGPKIQLVVALLLVPSVLLLVAAALISAVLGSGDAGVGGWA